MSHTEFKIWQSARTIAPGGRLALRVEVPADSEYTYEWCAESGQLYYPFHPCDDAPAAAPKGAPKSARAAAAKPAQAFTDTGPVPHGELDWVAGPEVGITSIYAVVHGPEEPRRLEAKVEVTPAAVPETLLRSLEQGFSELGGPRVIKLERSKSEETPNQPLWVAIRDRTRAIAFNEYKEFVDRVLCEGRSDGFEAACDKHGNVVRRLDHIRQRAETDICHGVDAYAVLRATTEAFLILHCGVNIDRLRYEDPANLRDEARRLDRKDDPPSFEEIADRLTAYLGNGRLPYIQRILRQNFSDQSPISSKYCEGILDGRVDCPCLLELIWSYWQEEGSLVQTMAALSLRFQNKRGRGPGRDPLGALELDPLRPLNNLLWGYIQDERDRLTVARRAYEYDHHYGLRLVGRAVPQLRSVDSRSKFLEAFHSLLHKASVFYQEDADTTVIADGFPLLNALREVHVLLAEGAHNQYGDLPWTARVEMLMEQWLLARPEARDFLRGRYMVPYQEPWMGQVDTMKKLQGWSDTSVTHFRNLSVDGEQILLSIRFDDWIDINDQDYARNWARYWRPEVQRYIHSYRAVTGVDLSAGDSGRVRVDATLPSVHLQRRLAAQRRS
jgi:hypothetical protein